jgi:large subunit ribosomal protein L10
MARPEKVATVEEIKEKLEGARAAVLTEYRGLKVSELAALRASLRAAEAEYKVYKNTLARRAAEEAGLAELISLLEGPTAITFVKGDAVAVAKALRDYSKTNANLVVKGGILGTRIIQPEDVAALADIEPGTFSWPGSPVASRPRWSRRPACSRRSPATWPTGSRP